MDKSRYRSFFDDAMFVVLVMVAAMASAALEASAVLGYSAGDAQTVVKSAPSTALPAGPMRSASSVDGALLSAVAPRIGRGAR